MAFSFKFSDLKQLEVFQVRNTNLLSKDRVISVDALRGFDMFWIMGGDMMFQGLDAVFQNKISAFLKVQMDHTEWFGFNFYDIIMPLFLFLVGVSMVFSFRKRLSAGDSDKAIWKHTLKRIAILWLLGMIVQGNLLTYDINQIQLYSNTLQAIASGYLIATILILYLPVIWQIVTTIGLMLAYWAIVALIPVGGSTAGMYSMDANVPIIFDHFILGRFDDGLEYTWIISSINFGATTMLGVFCGYIMQSLASKTKKLAYFILLAVVLIVLSIVWDVWHPIIKKIWTSSFVLFSGGLSVLLLALFYFLIDVLELRKGIKWMVILGSNAIFGYVAWHLFKKSFMYVGKVFIEGLEPYIGAWYSSLSYLCGFIVIYLIMRYMYKNKIFIKI